MVCLEVDREVIKLRGAGWQRDVRCSVNWEGDWPNAQEAAHSPSSEILRELALSIAIVCSEACIFRTDLLTGPKRGVLERKESV